MNYYGTEEYYRKLKHLETDVYTQENLKTPIEVTDLTDEYRLEHCYYADEKHKKPGWSAEDGSVNRLYKNGVKIFEWKTLDAETLTKKNIPSLKRAGLYDLQRRSVRVQRA